MEKRVEIYWLHVDEEMQPAHLKSCLEVLDQEERTVYERYLVDFKKVEFLLGRMLLKSMIGQKRGVLPEEVRFIKNEYGKLFLDSRHVAGSIKRPLFFNLSHSGRMLVCAFSEIEKTGIDVEAVKKDCCFEVMRTVFVPEEIAYVEQQETPSMKREAFYQLWTRKEAVMKALGKGFSLPPLSFSVPLARGRVDEQPFSYYTCAPLEGYMVSAAVEREEGADIRYEVQKVGLAELKASVRSRTPSSAFYG
ncbi:4'-phosphopantetheinyl transferase family protein [Brevibacillus borstelensis]|uniref:4'-phosphopantetheinyl transferase family protein n=1 Tax=Brevibacillus borstelensis TaxID=45462 RepID=UPI0030F8EC26